MVSESFALSLALISVIRAIYVFSVYLHLCMILRIKFGHIKNSLLFYLEFVIGVYRIGLMEATHTGHGMLEAAVVPLCLCEVPLKFSHALSEYFSCLNH